MHLVSKLGKFIQVSTVAFRAKEQYKELERKKYIEPRLESGSE